MILKESLLVRLKSPNFWSNLVFIFSDYCFPSKSVSSTNTNRICVGGVEGVQILELGPGNILISSENCMINCRSRLQDVNVDDAGDFWVSVLDGSLMRI